LNSFGSVSLMGFRLLERKFNGLQNEANHRASFCSTVLAEALFRRPFGGLATNSQEDRLSAEHGVLDIIGSVCCRPGTGPARAESRRMSFYAVSCCSGRRLLLQRPFSNVASTLTPSLPGHFWGVPGGGRGVCVGV
jgi:hypothetical protein